MVSAPPFPIAHMCRNVTNQTARKADDYPEISPTYEYTTCKVVTPEIDCLARFSLTPRLSVRGFRNP
jgi:hypothetical protein